jgi:PTH1 family peptidyl-tRNA hydrolase
MLGLPLLKRGFHSRYGQTALEDRAVILLCPNTFMNRSGEAVKACADFYTLPASRILIIHDDLDLPVGRVKVVKGGGAGGHRGVLSVIETLGTIQVPRVKIGIGRPRFDEKIDEYVLSPFYPDQKDEIEKALDLAAWACELYVLKGVTEAMNQINRNKTASAELKSE